MPTWRTTCACWCVSACSRATAVALVAWCGTHAPDLPPALAAALAGFLPARRAAIVARYGDYVLLKPPFNAETYLLWFGPLVLLLCGAGAAAIYYRRASMAVETAPLSDDESRRLAALIDGSESDTKGA